ncbi:MAG: creatininase family protein [Thermomicrobiales bacterium]|nr:creatininase family protein [Thermomicrobiales bacterium]
MPEDADNAPETPRLLLHELNRGEAAARAADALLVLPVGATEQHGPHLPLGTDVLIVEAIAREAARQARPDLDAIVAPTLPFGSSHHHLPFGGTISLATDRYYAALADMVESLITSGFRRLFILNGHGGNHEVVQLVARDLVLRYPVNIAAASYWDLAREVLASSASRDVLGGRFPGHAGDFETSVILALRPDLVGPLPRRDADALARAGTPATPFRAERHGFWRQIDGHTDSPHAATTERGQQLLDLIIPAVASAFRQFAAMPLE